MPALTREGPTQFRVDFDALAGRAAGRAKNLPAGHVDPYLVGRAVAEAMRACTARTASGRALLWNHYRVVLSRADFEVLGPLRASLDGDLEATLTVEAAERDAELVGAIRVSVVADESDELEPGQAVVRAGFVAAERPSDERRGRKTLRGDLDTMVPFEPPSRPARPAAPSAAVYRLAWPGGEATLREGETVLLGRPHPDAPGNFVPLEGASARINKRQLELTVSGSRVVVARLPAGNPVHVGEKSVPAGGQVEAKAPARISLSKGDLVLVLSRA